MDNEGKNLGKVFAIYNSEYPVFGIEFIRVEDEDQIYEVAQQSSELFYDDEIDVIRERLIAIRLEYLDDYEDLDSSDAIEAYSQYGWQTSESELLPDGSLSDGDSISNSDLSTYQEDQYDRCETTYPDRYMSEEAA
jgi:hypothetical protein